MIHPIPVDAIDMIWPQVREGLQRSIMKTGGDLTTAELWQGCRRGDFFLLAVFEGNAVKAASVWQPQAWQTGQKLRCLALYGAGMKEWIGDMHEAAKELARSCGATSIVSDGRAGWKPIFPQARVLRVVYEEQI